MPPPMTGFHHVAVICGDYARSKDFYTRILGFPVIAEVHRNARDSWKLDLALPDGGQIELFSLPAPPPRPTRPEAQGLRHLAFAVPSVAQWCDWLAGQRVEVEPVRTDPYTGKRFTFFKDPEG